jgi:hypothetical protein
LLYRFTASVITALDGNVILIQALSISADYRLPHPPYTKLAGPLGKNGGGTGPTINYYRSGTETKNTVRQMMKVTPTDV